MPPGVSGPPILATSHLWLSDAKTALLSPVLYAIRAAIADYILGFPGNRGPTGPEPMTLHTQLPTMHWVMGTAPTRFPRPPRSPLLQDRTRLRPSSISHLQEDWLPCPHFLARCHGTGGGNPSTRPLSYLGSPWNQLSKQQWELVHFSHAVATTTCN